MNSFKYLIVLCLFAISRVGQAQDSQPSSSDQTIPISKLKALVCEPNETSQWLALSEVSWHRFEEREVPGSLPINVDVSRNVFKEYFDINPAEWDPTTAQQIKFEHNLRFDFCSSPIGSVTLKRILIGQKDFKVRVIDPKLGVVKGFEEAVFGDNSQLFMEIPLAKKQIFRLREFKPQLPNDAQAIPSLFYGIGTLLPDGRIDPQNKVVAVGRTQMEVNPFGECAKFAVPGAYLEQSIQLGELKIEAKICVSSVGGDSFRYKVVGVRASHPKMKDVTSLKLVDNFFVAEGSQLKKVWQEKLTHHSSCDQFQLSIPGFVVAITTAAPYARADDLNFCDYFPGSPKPSEADLKAQYRLVYANGAREEGVLDQRFYFDEEVLGEIED